MATAGYYLFYIFNWIVTLLPLKILYGVSPVIYFIIYHFPSYRRKIVRENLRNSFPEKSEEEIILIEKKFYHHLADLFIEIMKLVHMPDKELKRRFKIRNTDVLEKLFSEKRGIIAVMGHYNNWEWLTLLSEFTSYKTISIYKPLHNKHFEKLINSFRTRYGMVLTPMSAILRELIDDQRKNILTLSAFIADQSPAKNEIKHWTNFLNQETPVYMGAEKIASRYDMALVYFHIIKVRRGYYEMDIEILFEHTAGLPDNILTEAHVRKLEQIIREKPEYWIWSHRRWKHKKPAENA
jgi:KDO2-lipid IV(A) lauroyltransferase